MCVRVALQIVIAQSQYTQITNYTYVSKTSIDINRNMEQRLRTLHLPAINQRRRQKKVTT